MQLHKKGDTYNIMESLILVILTIDCVSPSIMFLMLTVQMETSRVMKDPRTRSS